MKILWNVIGGLAGIYLLLVVAAFLLQDRMLFFPSGLSASVRERLQHLEISFERDGTVLRGWLFRRENADGRPFLVYYGGNGEELSWNLPRFAELPVSGILLVNYRGFGDSEGRPSAEALKTDATFILDEILEREGIDAGEVVLMGRSLGSGVAVHVAARRAVGGLILVTPFDRLSSIGAHHYPILPVRWLMRHEMDSVALAPEIEAPSLVVVAMRDGTVPPQYGQRLHQALGGSKEIATIAGADHNDLDGHAGYWRAVTGFLESLRSTE